uniref:Predicted GPI-anchored protein 58 n=1 Tax=Cicer arietinum TaxID=3827 RepID=A0A1S3DXC9_CICAR
MARVKQTQPHTPSPSSSSTSETPSPPQTLTKRVPIPTHKILAKDKGKAPAPIPEKTKKRKEPPTEKLMADAMKEIAQKRKKQPIPSPPAKKKTISSPPAKKVPAPKEKEPQSSISPDFVKRKIQEARTMDFPYFDDV